MDDHTKPDIISVNEVRQIIPISIQDALHAPGVSPEARALAQGITNGEILPCAPFPGMDIPMSAQKIAEFALALDRSSAVRKPKSKRKKK